MSTIFSEVDTYFMLINHFCLTKINNLDHLENPEFRVKGNTNEVHLILE